VSGLCFSNIILEEESQISTGKEADWVPGPDWKWEGRKIFPDGSGTPVSQSVATYSSEISVLL
jgi:hypothetical protein